MFDVWRQPFMAMAAAACVLLSLVAAPLGVAVVTTRMTFFATVVAQGGVVGIAVSVWLSEPVSAPSSGPLLVAVATALLLSALRRRSRLPREQLTSLLFAGSIGIAVCALSIVARFTNSHVLDQVLVGNILLITPTTLLRFAVGGAVILFVVFTHRRSWMLAAIHPALVRPRDATAADMLLAVAVAVCVVVAMPVVGAWLVEAVLVLPAFAAMSVCVSLRSTVVVATLVLLVSSLLGLWVSSVTPLPASGAMVVCLGCAAVGARWLQRWRR
jgi:zinc transport system permease protein